MELSEEEKKAKEYFKKYISDFEKRIGKKLTTEFNEHLKVLLNQVEKQQKEIEELKEQNMQLTNYLNDSYYVSADKIREKIKELERDMVLPETRQVLRELLEEKK